MNAATPDSPAAADLAHAPTAELPPVDQAPVPASLPSLPAAEPGWLQRAWHAWEEFWFRPADPTLLGLIRIGTGIMVLLTLLAYGFALEEFLGEHAWYDLSMRLQEVRDMPNDRLPLTGNPPRPAPHNADEEEYRRFYLEKFHEPPPGPYPKNETERTYSINYRFNFGVDLRKYGMPLPQTPFEGRYLEEFAFRYAHKNGYADAPAPPYPRDAQEQREIFDYLDRYGVDLHKLASRGQPVFSLWFYVTEPRDMYILHGVVMFVAVLFTLGVGTRMTSALTWFFNLNYIFRSPISLFGADTMTNILLLYLMLGPSGAALSLDRLIGRWWSRSKAPSTGSLKLVGANVVIRLMQIHLCIVYLLAGLAKMGGAAWWNGTAMWSVIGHPELAPMHLDIYTSALRLLARNETIFYLVLFIGTYFTLVFEIGYAFLIWTRLRRLFLISAVLLHGLIGVLMGLQTFTLIMVVMNAAFLTDAEVHWLLGWGRRLSAACGLALGRMRLLPRNP